MDSLLQDVLESATEQLLRGTGEVPNNQIEISNNITRETSSNQADSGLTDHTLEQVSLEFNLHVSKLRSGWVILFRDEFDLVFQDQPYLFKMLMVNARSGYEQ